MPFPDELTPDPWLEEGLRAALALDEDERAYLSGLDLAGTWRRGAASTVDARWGWLALFAVVTAFGAWAVAAQFFGDVLSTANEVGLSTVLLTSAVGLLLGASQTVIEISTSPALGFSQPLLGLLALALLLWPKYLQGVRS
jgi:hypothetical protein